MDHETMPHSPPAIKTGSGFECVESPVNVVSSCLLLSYVIKYRPVPSVSRTVKRMLAQCPSNSSRSVLLTHISAVCSLCIDQ